MVEAKLGEDVALYNAYCHTFCEAKGFYHLKYSLKLN